jgi:hypothetical protein
MTLFSQHFSLGKSQAELDFVDVPIDEDIPLFIDPFSISQRPDRWSQECHRTINFFFQQVVDSIRAGNISRAKYLLYHLREPNETRFGYSSGRPQGAGIGQGQAQQILDALSESAAVKTGFINALEEAELMIRGISRDKISDLTTNVLRRNLADYTKDQCDLHGIKTDPAPLPPYFSLASNSWKSAYYELPVAAGRPILLVPKVIARYDMAYDHRNYYRHFVLNYLQAEELNAGSSLVRVLKNGTRLVLKKDVEAKYPLSKEFLFEFSKKHPKVLQRYRDDLKKLEEKANKPLGRDEERALAKLLTVALKAIPGGGQHANDYHSLMVGILEFLFHPNLVHPTKEKEIHQGRKRIDILTENGATQGTLYRLHDIKKLPCAYVPIECKNYTTEVANPELDQLAGRFSTNRGKFGILCCRNFEDRDTFIDRCRDTFQDDRGLIVPLDDNTVITMLQLVESGQRDQIDRLLGDLISEVWI